MLKITLGFTKQPKPVDHHTVQLFRVSGAPASSPVMLTLDQQSISLTPPNPGTYTVQATSFDASGNTITTVTSDRITVPESQAFDAVSSIVVTLDAPAA